MEHRFSIGENAEVIIGDRSDGSLILNMYFGTDFEDRIEQLPWTVTANGKKEPWRSSNVYSGYLQHFGTVFIDKSQTVTFHLGEINHGGVQGPVDYSFYVARGDILSVGRVTQGVTTRRAIPYVNVNGVWRLAEAYAKHAGSWKQTI